MGTEKRSVAIVAGGGGDIGRAIAARLADKDRLVALFDRDLVGLDHALREIKPGHAGSYELDLTDADAVERAVAEVVEHWDVPDLLVTSVGNLGPHDPAVWEVSAADWANVFGVNMFAPINVIRAAMSHIAQRGTPVRIVVIASLMGLIPDSRMAAYTAAKHGLVSYAESVREQAAQRGLPVEVTVVCPGGVATQLNAHLRAATGQAPPPDWPTADEVAELVVSSLETPETYVFSHDGSREKLQAYYDEVLSAAHR